MSGGSLWACSMRKLLTKDVFHKRRYACKYAVVVRRSHSSGTVLHSEYIVVRPCLHDVHLETSQVSIEARQTGNESQSVLSTYTHVHMYL